MDGANTSVAVFGKCQAGGTVSVVSTGCCPSVVSSTSPGLLGWYLLHVLATVLGGTAILRAMDVPSWMRNLCGWQIQPQVASCSRCCLANCLSFHHTSRISSFSSSVEIHQWCLIFFIVWLKSRKVYHQASFCTVCLWMEPRVDL